MHKLIKSNVTDSDSAKCGKWHAAYCIQSNLLPRTNILFLVSSLKKGLIRLKMTDHQRGATSNKKENVKIGGTSRAI